MRNVAVKRAVVEVGAGFGGIALAIRPWRAGVHPGPGIPGGVGSARTTAGLGVAGGTA